MPDGGTHFAACTAAGSAGRGWAVPSSPPHAHFNYSSTHSTNCLNNVDEALLLVLWGVLSVSQRRNVNFGYSAMSNLHSSSICQAKGVLSAAQPGSSSSALLHILHPISLGQAKTLQPLYQPTQLHRRNPITPQKQQPQRMGCF